MNLEPGQRFSHYDILERLGSGGMGVVYRARDLRLKRMVALKLLGRTDEGPDQVRRFLREAESAAALSHPRIVHIYEVDEHDGVPFLAMEHLPSGSLRDRLARGRPSVDEVLRWSSDVAEALAEAHRRGIVHRDVKPSNVLLDEQGHAKLADFGLARQIARESITATESRLTGAGVLLGTPGYLSPECALGDEVGPPADVFALGCSIFELLSGRVPFERRTPVDALHALVYDPPPPLPEGDLPGGLAGLIERTLEKEPEKRPSARAVADELLSVAGGWRGPSEAPTVAAKQAALPMRGKLLWAAATGALLVATLATAWWARRPALGFKERETILIGALSNSTGEPALEGSLATALQISLEQSRYVNVLSPERVRQALQRMRRGDEEKLDENVAREVCQREGARALLSGGVDRIGDEYQVTVRIVDPVSGSSVRTLTRKAADRGRILSALDDLAHDVREALGESLPSISRASVPLAQATTASLEALQLFSQASALSLRGRVEEARKLLERALELDPDFARAYAALASTYRSFQITVDESLAERYFQEALKRLDRVGERERLEIQGLYNGVTGRHGDAANYYRLLIERYPDVHEYHYSLGRVYMFQSRYPEAIAEYEAALRLDPRSAATLIGLATSHASLKDSRQQIAHLERAFALEPAWETDSIQNHQYGWALVVTGEEGRGRAAFAKMLAKGGTDKARGLRSLALVALYRGRVADGVRGLREAAWANESAGAQLSAARDRLYLAEALVLVRSNSESRAELARAAAKAAQLGHRPAWLSLRVAALEARLGRTVEAARLIESARGNVSLENLYQRTDLWRSEGELQLSRGRTEEALETLRRAHADWSWWLTRSSLARALERAGRKQEAITAYRELALDQPEAWEGHLDWALAHSSLARLHEETGRPDEARAMYAKLLEIWKEADPDLAPLLEARRAHLRLSQPPAR